MSCEERNPQARPSRVAPAGRADGSGRGGYAGKPTFGRTNTGKPSM